MILLCPPEKSTQFHYPLDPKKIPAEGSIHKDTTYQGSDRQDFYRHGKKKKEKKENKQTKRRPRLGLPIGNPVIKYFQNMRHKETWPALCTATLVSCSDRDWTRFCYIIGFENIRIHPSTRYRIRCRFFFPLWRAD